MPHALLLSPDDQAVNAITGVLEEMSVTCERPMDGVSAAQKLNSQSFDLVLVDCENLPAAKLIFDVCRRGKNGNNPVPIAIVDGRAGLPTAFRLGAELILTKPVAKDQARSTIRTAVSRVRKDVQSNDSVPPQATSGAMPGAAAAGARAHSAAATAVSSPLTNPVESASAASGTATLSAPVLTPELHPMAGHVDAAPATPEWNPQQVSSYSSKAPSTSSALSPSSSPSTSSQSPAGETALVDSNELSEDPVLAELVRVETEQLEATIPALDKPVPDKPAAEANVEPVFSYPGYGRGQGQGQGQGQRRRASLIALLMLALALGGFYAVWTYQPGFRELAQPQIDRVLALAGISHQPRTAPPAPASSPAKPPVPLATTTASATGSSSDTNQIPSTAAAGSAASAATGSGKQSATTPATAPAPAASTPATTVASPTSAVAITAAPLSNKPETSKPGDGKVSNKDAVAVTSSDTPITGESSAIILSSKGAEKRLAQSAPPKYPVEARPEDTQGTVVLKAVIDESGKVAGLRLVEGNGTLATAAIQAVKQWRYRPYVRDGKAVPFQTVVIVDFQRP